jgi:hypothetical protein
VERLSEIGLCRHVAAFCYDPRTMNRTPGISFVSLGYTKAQVDSERLITRLRADDLIE